MSSPDTAAQTINAVLAWAQTGLRPEDANLVRAEADAGEEYFAFLDSISIAHHDGPALPAHLDTAVQALAAQEARFRDDLSHATHPDVSIHMTLYDLAARDVHAPEAEALRG